MRLLILLLFLTGCLSKKDTPVNIHPELEPYVFEFIEDAKKFNKHFHLERITIDIINAPPSHVNWEAVCYPNPSHPRIYFYKKYYNLYKKRKRFNQIKATMYHELGHCILGRKHNDAETLGFKHSLMNSYGISDKAFVSYQDYYLNELFTIFP